jgi:ATP-dependent Clp protease ATP-binding subunit ClpX
MSDERGKSDGPQPRCAFCREEQNTTVRMIKGPNVYICEDCVNICRKLLHSPAGR